MSRRDTFNRRAVCPFFRAAYDRTIRCDGLITGSELRSSFHSYKAVSNHVRTVCGSDTACKTCPIYTAHEKSSK